jgi:hypothetical protein
MPWGNGTGPQGEGPMTGRGMGYCAGYSAPGFTNPAPRRGLARGRGFRRGMAWRRGFGRGFGWNRWNWTPVQTVQSVQPTKEQEIQFLEDEIKTIENEKRVLDREVGEIKKRLKQLKKD